MSLRNLMNARVRIQGVCAVRRMNPPGLYGETISFPVGFRKR